jgi:signal transduction histidine kinase
MRGYIILVVVLAAVLPVVVGLLAVFGATPVEETGERDEQLARVTTWLLMRDLASTPRVFALGTELFDLPALPDEEKIGVLRMLYKQDEDVDIVVLLDERGQTVVEPVYLREDQVRPGTTTAHRLPANEEDIGKFLKYLPMETAQESGRAFSGVYINRRKNVAMIAGAVAVPRPAGAQPWVLGFERSLRRARQTVSAGVGELGYSMFVVDGGGRLVVHPDGRRFLARETVEQHPVVAKFLKGGNAGSSRWEDEQGNAFLGAFQRLDFLDWAVVVQHPLLPLRALGWRIPAWAWVAWGVLAALIVAAVLMLQKTVTRILVEMKKLRDDAEHRADELKRMQASLLESRKMSAIGDLGAGVAHEFNNPLGGILGLTQLLLRRKKEGDPDLQFLQRIEQEAKRCKVITDNLLRFSEQQGIEYREPIHLGRVLDMTVDLMTRKLESQRIQIERKFSKDLPRVMGNEGQLQKVFLNVLLNSETAMPEGGKLVLATERDGNWVLAHIADTGKGIAPENVERVFEPFFTTKDQWRGAGLGLSVVYQIVKDHQGEVSVESREGQGTMVTFRFPREEKAAGQGKKPAPVPLA